MRVDASLRDILIFQMLILLLCLGCQNGGGLSDLKIKLFQKSWTSLLEGKEGG